MKGAALFLPERSPLMGAGVIFCMISCIHWQLINLRTIFTRTLMSLMQKTEQKLHYALSFHFGVEYYIITQSSTIFAASSAETHTKASQISASTLEIINCVMKRENKTEKLQNPLKISVAQHRYISSILRWNDNAQTTNLSRLMP